MVSKEKNIVLLNEQQQLIRKAKAALIELTGYEEAVLFSDFDKRIKNQIRILENSSLVDEEKSKTFLATPYIEIFGIKKHFSKRVFKLLNSIEPPIYTNKIVIEILSKKNVITNSILELDVDITALIKDLKCLVLNDIVSRETPLISLKSKRVIHQTVVEAKQFDKNKISIFILFLSILKFDDDITTKLLNNYGITYELFLVKLELKLGLSNYSFDNFYSDNPHKDKTVFLQFLTNSDKILIVRGEKGNGATHLMIAFKDKLKDRNFKFGFFEGNKILNFYNSEKQDKIVNKMQQTDFCLFDDLDIFINEKPKEFEIFAKEIANYIEEGGKVVVRTNAPKNFISNSFKSKLIANVTTHYPSLESIKKIYAISKFDEFLDKCVVYWHANSKSVRDFKNSVM